MLNMQNKINVFWIILLVINILFRYNCNAYNSDMDEPASHFSSVLTWEQIVKQVSEDIEKNDPRAMAIMAYWISVGLQKVDIPKAIELANKSTELGCPLGSFSLACIDYSRTKDNDGFRLAYPKIYDMAQSGDAFAQYVVGCYYAFGLGDVERNYNIAAKWINQSIAKHQLEAIDLGGLILAKVYGKPQDGYNMYLRAAKRGFPHSMMVFARAWWMGQGFTLTECDSTIWLEKAADANYGPALYSWAQKNYKNKDKMRELIKKGAELNDSCSLKALADQHIANDLEVKNYDEWHSISLKAVDCGTFNATRLGADDDNVISQLKSRISDYDKRMEREKEDKQRIARIEQRKIDLMEKIAAKFGKGKDDCYQIVVPKLLSTKPEKRLGEPSSFSDKEVIIDSLYGMIQRFWPEKDNLFCKLDYGSYTMTGPIVSIYDLTISVGGKLAGANEIARSDFGFFTLENKSSILLSEKDVGVFVKIYPIFKKWELNFKEANEVSKATKMIEKPFAFIWNGDSAQLGIIKTNQGGDYISETCDSNFVDQIKYCIDQIPEMQNLLKKSQSIMRQNIESSSSRINELTN
jgi:hypothetical protein